jgi:hypothetical protein
MSDNLALSDKRGGLPEPPLTATISIPLIAKFGNERSGLGLAAVFALSSFGDFLWTRDG